jgi:hypothetical protein
MNSAVEWLPVSSLAASLSAAWWVRARTPGKEMALRSVISWVRLSIVGMDYATERALNSPIIVYLNALV